MEQLTEKQLLAVLQRNDEDARSQATAVLWERWYTEKGSDGLRALEQSEALASAGEVDRAEATLSALIRRHPDFAEAWNRRAVLRFEARRYRDAIADCKQVVRLKPWHFGALHGLGLCHVALRQFAAAATAFRRALEVQPYASANLQLLRQCVARLN